MRISDIIAYLGKDRQDAERTGMISSEDFTPSPIGTYNAAIINNLMVNIIEHSYNHDYIRMDDEHFEALRAAKSENYNLIYKNPVVDRTYGATIRPMMTELYELLLDDVRNVRRDSPIFTHHIDYVSRSYYERTSPYEQTEPNQIVVDYIASMTDDYFLDLHRYLFPNSTHTVEYFGYFDEIKHS